MLDIYGSDRDSSWPKLETILLVVGAAVEIFAFIYQFKKNKEEEKNSILKEELEHFKDECRQLRYNKVTTERSDLVDELNHFKDECRYLRDQYEFECTKRKALENEYNLLICELSEAEEQEQEQSDEN